MTKFFGKSHEFNLFNYVPESNVEIRDYTYRFGPKLCQFIQPAFDKRTLISKCDHETEVTFKEMNMYDKKTVDKLVSDCCKSQQTFAILTMYQDTAKYLRTALSLPYSDEIYTTHAF